MKSALEQLARHEDRLTKLEYVKSDANSSLKDELVKMLLKCLLVAITAIGSLAGAGSIISQMLN